MFVVALLCTLSAGFVALTVVSMQPDQGDDWFEILVQYVGGFVFVGILATAAIVALGGCP